MEQWEKALDSFLIEWRRNPEVTAVMVCGSYVTGNPSPRSDIDIHIILDKNLNWRERGNKIVNGFVIEYFANPPKQIIKYFEEDYRNKRTMSMVQFLTGKVLFDRTGIIEQLKMEAAQWKNKKYEEMNETFLEIKKYSIWDSYDNLLDCYEQDRSDFLLVYHNSLCQLFSDYCSFIGYQQIPYYKIHSFLTDPKYKEKYLTDPFPDDQFRKLFIKVIEENVKELMMERYKELYGYVLEKMGGFHIDGWKIKTNVE
ncbi:nucleotidyltransferase domain-containing protein [Chengkuizengella axinellae]|uniref:Nucleotidyltransferase domain-containing protein n=1 Tax=Chengkuizengella axinellae TaxID=3064388 RepID=A0ABT9IU44_9BACL|nr:nucleotidyltransferase domain-containing protein [Chengkuizengella sp. 2205SS18-9]MDP5272876.1 nucleotidyltransferase domain-containing protein [Chengkuizengella sp. 2205SS18-9]